MPSVGSTVRMSASSLIDHPISLGIDEAKGINRYCIDRSFLAAVNKPSNSSWEQRLLEYILVTGANWSGTFLLTGSLAPAGRPQTRIFAEFYGLSAKHLGRRISSFGRQSRMTAAPCCNDLGQRRSRPRAFRGGVAHLSAVS